MLTDRVLVDTGPLVALYNARDPHHEECTALIKQVPFGRAFTCLPVVTEATYLLRKYPTFRDDLLRSVLLDEFALLPIEPFEIGAVLDIFPHLPRSAG